MKQSKTKFGFIGAAVLALLLAVSFILAMPNGYVGDAARIKESLSATISTRRS